MDSKLVIPSTLKDHSVSWSTKLQVEFQYVQNIQAQQRKSQMWREFSSSLLELVLLQFIKLCCQLLTILKTRQKLFFFSAIVNNTIFSSVNDLKLCSQESNWSTCWMTLLHHGKAWQEESIHKFLTVSSLLLTPIHTIFHVDHLLSALPWRKYLKNILNPNILKSDQSWLIKK